MRINVVYFRIIGKYASIEGKYGKIITV